MRNFYLLFIGLFILSCNKEKVQSVVAGKKLHAFNLAANSDSLTILKSFRINGAACPIDINSKTFYFPTSAVNPVNSCTVNYDSVGIKSFLIDNQPVKSNTLINVTLTTNEVASVQITDTANNVYNCSLVITGLPILNSHVTSVDVIDTLAYCNLELIDPDYVAHNGTWLVNSNISMGLHGSGSRYYPKQSADITMLDANNNDLNISLLGLRSDQSWVLDAMYVDQSRMRNRLCTDIWNSFNNVPYIASQPTAHNGCRGYLVEAFLNDAYMGVFALNEKMDRKEIQANKTYGVVYKADDPTTNTLFSAPAISYDDNSSTWAGWEISWPNAGSTPAPTWSYLSNFDNFVSTSSDSLFTAQIGTMVNIDNVVDYFLFINVIAANDNTGKNQYFSFYSSQTNPQFFYSVWDLDTSFGRNSDNSYFEDPGLIALGTDNNLVDRLYALDVDGYREKTKARWNALKNSQLSKAAINSRILAYAEQLILTNAGNREIARWGNLTQSFSAETTYMSNWYSTHYDELDNYINGNF
jgi:hypothetical protein